MQVSPPTTFRNLALPASLCDRLAEQGITIPTPIQAGAIPLGMMGRDVIGVAQTGTGKTLAFGIPMAMRLDQQRQGLVIAPTRELAQQIEETLQKLRLQSVLLVGGASMRNQLNELKKRPTVIVATPGRLIDHMEQGTVRLDRVSCVVLDEADRMLDMGFAPAIQRIMRSLPTDRQTMLFSATMPDEIKSLAESFLRNPERVEVAREGEPSELVEQELVFLEVGEKTEYLDMLLYKNQGTVLIFSRTRHGARKLARWISKGGHKVAEIHSDRSLAQRREALEGFKKGRYRILVATDIAARGIDVKEISLVINYDLPDQPEDYVHRIGRTGRAGHRGRAISLALGDQGKLVRQIEKVMGKEMPISQESTIRPVLPPIPKPSRVHRKVAKAAPAPPPMAAPKPKVRFESKERAHPHPSHNPKPKVEHAQAPKVAHNAKPKPKHYAKPQGTGGVGGFGGGAGAKSRFNRRGKGRPAR
ncbi:MAG: DEAD/DEAH box helicase [Chthonomonas sp.]|nr:DEAD/DEAH box helicase [Chthonomonas sp.]